MLEHTMDRHRTREPHPGGRVTVHVEHNRQDDWEVVAPNGLHLPPCGDFDEARRIAYLAVAHVHACELIVHATDGRVLERELIEGHTSNVRNE